MDRLRDVLGRKSGYLARALEVHAGIEAPLARRFVEIAGEDLIESYTWQKSEIDRRELTDPTNARDLLSVAYAGYIAAELGIPRTQVWAALRTFVPRVLQLAEAISPARGEIEPPSMGLTLRWSRPAATQSGMLLHPMD